MASGPFVPLASVQPGRYRSQNDRISVWVGPPLLLWIMGIMGIMGIIFEPLVVRSIAPHGAR